MKKATILLLAVLACRSALIAQTDTGFVTLNKNETITGVKTFSPTLTGNGASVFIVPRFTTTANGNQLYGLDIANPVVSNPGGYTGISAMVARLRGSILVEGTADISTVRTNNIMRGGDVAFTITKAGSANVANQLIFKQTIGATATSSLVNSTIFLDTIHFSANTTAEGYSHVRLTPALIQTGYSGITRGLYITPVLTDVTNFRAVETDVSSGNGYQLYAGGTGRNYFKGTTSVDSTWSFSSDIQVANQVFCTNARSNAWTYRFGNAGMSVLKPTAVTVGPDIFKIITASNVNVNNTIRAATSLIDSVTMITNTGTSGLSMLNVQSYIKQTGYSGPSRGVYVNPVLVDVTDFRAIQTNVSSGNGFQLYAGGTAPSYFAGNVGIGTANPQSLLAVNGTITTQRITVTKTGWADYVFDSAYQLTPLRQVEKYIQQNKHLPDVPSAATVEKTGVDVGDTQALLLKKIEELTLYIIEQNKEVQELKQQMKELQEKVK